MTQIYEKCCSARRTSESSFRSMWSGGGNRAYHLIEVRCDVEVRHPPIWRCVSYRNCCAAGEELRSCSQPKHLSGNKTDTAVKWQPAGLKLRSFATQLTGTMELNAGIIRAVAAAPALSDGMKLEGSMADLSCE